MYAQVQLSHIRECTQKCQLQVLNNQTLTVNLINYEGDWYLDANSVRGLFDLQPAIPTTQYSSRC